MESQHPILPGQAEEIEEAMQVIFEDAHNVAEGAGAAAVAALLRDRDRVRGQSVGVILTGSNVDSDVFSRVLRRKA